MTRPLSRGQAFGLAAVLFTAAAVGACGGQATGSSPSPVASPTPSSTPDIASAFAQKLSSGMPRARCDITGSMQMGSVTATITGEYTTADGDTFTDMTVTASDGSTSRTGSATINGRSYELTDAGYWLIIEPGAGASPAPQGPGGAFEEAFAKVTTYKVLGTDTLQGQTIYRLEPTTPVPLDADAFGVGGTDVAGFGASLTFLARADGSLAGFDLAASWQKGTGADGIPVSMNLRWLIKDTSTTISVVVPPDTWMTHSSTELGYSMVYPLGWDVSHELETDDYYATDIYLGPTDGEIDVARYTDAASGSQPNAVFRQVLGWLTDEATDTPEVLTDVVLSGGATVRIFGLHVADPEPAYMQVAVLVSSTEVWELNWYSQPGDEESDQGAFLRSVLSFTRTE